MLRAVFMALTLEGVLPGITRPRRPVPVVRYERTREPRALRNLRHIARRLLGTADPHATVAVSGFQSPETQSLSGATGAQVVVFRTR
jgi:hypothetical protein